MTEPDDTIEVSLDDALIDAHQATIEATRELLRHLND